jgi:hypothetical protein
VQRIDQNRLGWMHRPRQPLTRTVRPRISLIELHMKKLLPYMPALLLFFISFDFFVPLAKEIPFTLNLLALLVKILMGVLGFMCAVGGLAIFVHTLKKQILEEVEKRFLR